MSAPAYPPVGEEAHYDCPRCGHRVAVTIPPPGKQTHGHCLGCGLGLSFTIPQVPEAC